MQQCSVCPDIFCSYGNLFFGLGIRTETLDFLFQFTNMKNSLVILENVMIEYYSVLIFPIILRINLYKDGCVSSPTF